MEFFDVLDKRYSVRSFSSEEAKPEEIAQILGAARMAPTAGNRQPVRILAIEGEGLAKVDETTNCRYSAPLVFLICFEEARAWVRPYDGQDSGFTDASIATTYMMLTAEALGLGTLWILFFDAAKAKEAFALPEGLTPAFYLACGRPSEASAPSPRHAERLELKDILL